MGLFRRPRSLGLRLWHWLNAMVIFGILLTVLLRKTLYTANTQIIQNQLSQEGLNLTHEQSRQVAREITHHLWHWHVYLGYTLAFLLSLRVVVAFIDRRQNKSHAKPLPQPKSLHYQGVKGLYAIFYVVVAAMISTGFAMVFGNTFQWSESTRAWIGGVHENLMWVVLGFTFLHLGGVVVAEVQDDAGIVSDMINGG